MSKLRHLKRIPIPLLIAVALVVILGSIALASVTVNRSGHVTRTLSQQLNVSANQDLTLPLDGTTGTVQYTVTNPGPVAETVTVDPTCDPGMSISANKTSFPLAVGASEVITLTITFTDGGKTAGDYSVTFQAI